MFQRQTQTEASTTEGTVIPHSFRNGGKEGEVSNQKLFRSLERNVKLAIQKGSQERRNIFNLSKPKCQFYYSKQRSAIFDKNIAFWNVPIFGRLFFNSKALIKLHFKYRFKSFLTEITGGFYYMANLLLPYIARFAVYVHNHTEHRDSLSGKKVFNEKIGGKSDNWSFEC